MKYASKRKVEGSRDKPTLHDTPECGHLDSSAEVIEVDPEEFDAPLCHTCHKEKMSLRRRMKLQGV